MIIEFPQDEFTIVKWKNNDEDEWKVVDISDLIKAYESPKKEIIPVCKVTFDNEELKKMVDEKAKEIISELKEKPHGDFTRKELEGWLYAIADHNFGNDFGGYCKELISRLDGFEHFVLDMRGKEE